MRDTSSGDARSCGCATALPDLHHYFRIESKYLTTNVMVGLTAMHSIQQHITHRYFQLPF